MAKICAARNEQQRWAEQQQTQRVSGGSSGSGGGERRTNKWFGVAEREPFDGAECMALSGAYPHPGHPRGI